MKGEKKKVNNKIQKEIVITIKKSEYAAGSKFDYKRLEYPQERFLPCQIEENGEELVIKFQVENQLSFSEIHKERSDHKLAILLDAAEIIGMGKEYDITLNPENLFYDQCFRVKVMERDVYKRGIEFNEGKLLEEYKALIGYSLQKRYGFEHYRDGGLELLRKHKFLSKVYDCTCLAEIKELLYGEYKEKSEKIKETKIIVDKNSFFLKKGYAVILSFLCVGMLGIGSYYMVVMQPKEQAVLASDRAFIENDYLKIIDVLKPLDADDLDLHHKYTLAFSYVKSENLSNEQRTNIISGLSVKGDERVLRYWVAIGRLNVAEAENLAMQCSNDELLLYAYLKEKSLVENNTQMNGEEKAGRLGTLSKEIEDLSKKYTMEEE